MGTVVLRWRIGVDRLTAEGPRPVLRGSPPIRDLAIGPLRRDGPSDDCGFKKPSSWLMNDAVVTVILPGGGFHVDA